MDSTWVNIIVFIVGFVLGTAFGYFVKSRILNKGKPINIDKTISIIVTTVWAISVVSEIFVTGYTTSPLVHGIMGGLAGYLWTKDRFKKKKNES